MKLRLERDPGRTATLGTLFVDDAFECYTLEDPCRDVKIPGDTAIPFGTFSIIVAWSPKFQRPLPLVIGVPNFSGVRIHPGNTTADTEGCLLVGEEIDGDRLLNSRVAFEKLFPKISKACEAMDGVSITIVRKA